MPLRKAARRRYNGENKTSSGILTEPRGTVVGERGQGESNGPGTTRVNTAEVFPTGLVVSRHFRESCSGREILMLEIEKVQ